MIDGNRSRRADDLPDANRSNKSSRFVKPVVLGLLVPVVVGTSVWWGSKPKVWVTPITKFDSRVRFFRNAALNNPPDAPFVKLWWGDIPAEVLEVGTERRTDASSNIHPEDYVGPNACQHCHPKNHESWSRHSHRRMNALADSSTVLGDFTNTEILYLGGKATFYQESGQFRMRLAREQTRIFVVHQTIGSRFFQAFIGKQVSGPVAGDRKTYLEDHVLPFAYWIEPRQWVPKVHTYDERPDGRRMDPFNTNEYAEEFATYAVECKLCHTTIAFGDVLSGNARQMAREVPVRLHWSASGYLRDVSPASLSMPADSYSGVEFWQLLKGIAAREAPTSAVTLGISCEACHFGCREHTQNPDVLPKFFPYSPHLRVESVSNEFGLGRTQMNLNWTCGRCHTGSRPKLAAGMGTWNSAEFTDAMAGSCYSELQCIDCHNPHEPTGPKWSLPSAKEDELCIRCHQKYDSAQAQASHTHHQTGSEGSRCMNCHMPRVTEGIQDVVRTHTIFSPTNADMILQNQPNACNQCHADRSIDWTVDYLGKWYGATYKSESLDEAHGDRAQPASLGWLHSDNESVRLLGADALIRSKSRWALNDLLGALDDEFLLNRQFARRGLEAMLGVKLDDYGYRFYMTPEERSEPISRIRKALVPSVSK